jgi:WXG100 family type VII secretion target
MADTIQISYEALSDLSRRFELAHENMAGLHRKLHQHIDELRGKGWVGQGANSFYQEMDSLLLPSLSRCANSMQLAQETVQVIMKEFQLAEEDAKSILNGNMQDNDVAGIGAKTAATAYAKNEPFQTKFNYAGDNPRHMRDGSRTGADISTADIIYVNGILTGPDAHLDTLDTLNAKFEGKQIAGIYNLTEGFVKDAKQALFDRWSIEQDNLAVESLVSAVKERLQNGGTFEIIAHSQGAAITAEAMRQLKEQNVDLSRLKITSLGGFGVDFPSDVNVTHFVHAKDTVGISSVEADPNLAQNTKVLRTSNFMPLKSNLDDHAVDLYIQNYDRFQQNGVHPQASKGFFKDDGDYYGHVLSTTVSATASIVTTTVSTIGNKLFGGI